MNELVTRQTKTGLAISTETKELMQSSIAESTRLRYKRVSKQIGAWLRSAERESRQVGSGQMLNDALLARYITEL